MEIQLNGERRELAPSATVADLIAALDLGGRRVAVEVNGDVVPRSQHSHHRLDQNDQVELIGAIGGG